MTSLSSSAAQNALLAQNSVAERRLKPIYNWLDNGEYKKALQEANRVLKKSPDFQCCRALKALALLRMGNEKEAASVLGALLRESPVEEGTLQAMTMSFRDLHQPGKVCLMYENACRKDPGSEELLTGHFMACVRADGLYKKQHQVALALYKVRPKNPYYFWAVMSLVMQVVDDGDLVNPLPLVLAERMIEKMIDEHKADQEQEMYLYLMVLERLGKHDKILAILEEEANDGSIVSRVLREQAATLDLIPLKRIECLIKLGRWERVLQATRDYLATAPDQWSTLLDHNEAAFQLQQQQRRQKMVDCRDEESAVFDVLVEAYEFLEQLIEGHPGCRGPSLARMDFLLRLRTFLSEQLGDAEAEAAEKIRTVGMAEVAVRHFERFGGKPSCAVDMMTFLSALDKADFPEVVQRSWSTIKFAGEASAAAEELPPFPAASVPADFEWKPPAGVVDLQRFVNWYHVQEFLSVLLGQPAEGETKVRAASRLVDLYEACRPFLANLAPTDFRPNTTLLYIAARLCFEEWVVEEGFADTAAPVDWTTCSHTYEKALGILSLAIGDSPADHTVRLLLVKFLNRGGEATTSRAFASAFGDLGLKHVQLDSMGYLVWRHRRAWSKACISSYNDCCDPSEDDDGGGGLGDDDGCGGVGEGNCGGGGEEDVAAAFCQESLTFFVGSQREIVDNLATAYRCGSFEKVKEFVGFRRRLLTSIHFTEALLSHLEFQPSLDPALSDRLEACGLGATYLEDDLFFRGTPQNDNRDFSVVSDVWRSSPPGSQQDGFISGNHSDIFRHELLFTRLRFLSIRAKIVAAFFVKSLLTSSSSSSSNNPAIGHHRSSASTGTTTNTTATYSSSSKASKPSTTTSGVSDAFCRTVKVAVKIRKIAAVDGKNESCEADSVSNGSANTSATDGKRLTAALKGVLDEVCRLKETVFDVPGFREEVALTADVLRMGVVGPDAPRLGSALGNRQDWILINLIKLVLVLCGEAGEGPALTDEEALVGRVKELSSELEATLAGTLGPRLRKSAEQSFRRTFLISREEDLDILSNGVDILDAAFMLLGVQMHLILAATGGTGSDRRRRNPPHAGGGNLTTTTGGAGSNSSNKVAAELRGLHNDLVASFMEVAANAADAADLASNGGRELSTNQQSVPNIEAMRLSDGKEGTGGGGGGGRQEVVVGTSLTSTSSSSFGGTSPSIASSLRASQALAKRAQLFEKLKL